MRIKITSKNINFAASQLAKYFHCTDPLGSHVFLSGHNFDCGWKYKRNYRNDVNDQEYYDIPTVEIATDDSKPCGIRLRFGKNVAAYLAIGDKFEIRSPFLISSRAWNATSAYKYLYEWYHFIKTPTESQVCFANNWSNENDYEYEEFWEDCI